MGPVSDRTPQRRTIIISAINVSQGGALSILNESLDYLQNFLSREYQIIALVHNERQFHCPDIKFISFPNSKKSWLNRIFYEYVYFWYYSKKIKPYLWFSLHDMTPNVSSLIRAVYCHNPSPFYKLTGKEVYLDFHFALFNLFYFLLYRINIKRNDYVVVQQNDLRDKFSGLVQRDKIVVAHPDINLKIDTQPGREREKTFFYPAFPRVFKNFEVLGEACKILVGKGITDFKILWTISGRENRYARDVYKKYGALEQIEFLGLLNREDVFTNYRTASCVIFPSKLETWGVPITEAKIFDKPILLADLPYGREALGEYGKAAFFDPENPVELAGLMKAFMDKTIIFQQSVSRPVDPPFTQNWRELFAILLSEKKKS